MAYAPKTCAECGCKSPQNQMTRREVAKKATFKSHKSVTPLTFIGRICWKQKGQKEQSSLGLLQHQAEKALLMLAQKRCLYVAQTLAAVLARAHLTITWAF